MHLGKSLERILAIETADVYVKLQLVTEGRAPRAGSVLETLRARGLQLEAQEAFYVVATDSEQVRYVACVARGDYHRVNIPIPALLAIPLLAGADHVTVAHNHPSDTERILPSSQDMETTATLIEAFNKAGVTVDDHIIMGPAGHLSLRDMGVIGPTVPEQAEVRA